MDRVGRDGDYDHAAVEGLVMEKWFEYMGYTARLEYSAEDGCYFGRLDGINGMVNFEGETPEAAEAAFRESVEDHIKYLLASM